MAAMQLSLRRTLLAAGLATVPYLAINLGEIIVHDGSFIHFSKVEAAIITGVLAFFLWLVSAIVLAISRAFLAKNAWLYTCGSVVGFAAVATVVEPSFWTHMFDLLNDGLAEWVFRTGVLATILAFIFHARLQPAR